MLAFGFLGSYCFIAMLNSRVIKEEECKENRNQGAGAGDYLYLSAGGFDLVFSMIQIVYLFMGQMEAATEGYTYSSYARQGFSSCWRYV